MKATKKLGGGHNVLDLRRHKYGLLKVLDCVGRRVYGIAARNVTLVWRCRCQCGAVVEKNTQQLRTTKLPGCSNCTGRDEHGYKLPTSRKRSRT